jgi:hypothetical protein
MRLSNRQKYLVDELWILAWNASVQRAGVYNDSVKRDGTDRRIAAFKETMIKIHHRNAVAVLSRKMQARNTREAAL